MPTKEKKVTSKLEKLEKASDAEVRRRTKPHALVVYEVIRREGEDELDRPWSALAFSGLAAGLSMGFSFVMEAFLYSGMTQEGVRFLVSKLGYSVGFLFVILGRQQLFTENTITPVLSFLRKKSSKTAGKILRLWGIVLISNLCGALIFALMLAHTDVVDTSFQPIFATLAGESMVPDFWLMLLRSVFAGWLIALMVWLLPFADTARVSIIILVTYVIGLGAFPHIIAGSIKTLYMVALGSISVWDYLSGFFLPALLGNVVGGVALVAAINHAQVHSGRSDVE